MRFLLVNDVSWRVTAVSFLVLRSDTGSVEQQAGVVFTSQTGERRFYPMSPPPTQAVIEQMDLALLEEFLLLARFEP